MKSINFQDAILYEANFQGAKLYKLNLKSAQLESVRLDGMTIIRECYIDKKTDFTGVGLDAAIIIPGLKTALKDNIRRIQWRKWVKEALTRRQRWYRKAVDLFWRLSDYGSSTGRIIVFFFALAAIFGCSYWFFAMLPGEASIIAELRQVDGQPAYGGMHTLARSLYFSIVTMTTLGFGDMHATTIGGWQSCLGYLFLSIQVILGYVLLGALVTRLGILFTSEAPAATPAQIKAKDES